MSASDPQPAGPSRIRPYTECALWLAIALGMWGYSYAFDIELSTYALGPVAWPRAIIVIIVLAAIGAFIVDWQAHHNGRGAPASPAATEEASGELDGAGKIRLAAAILLPLVYVWLLPRAGYFATTPVFLAAYMYILGMTSWRTIIGTTVAASAVLLLIFSKLLYIPLPTGNWPGFYDFSNWILVVLR